MAAVVVGSHSLLQLALGKRRRRRRAPPLLRPFRPSSDFIVSNHSPPSFLLPPHASLPQHPKLFFGSGGGPSSSTSSLHHRLKPIPALDSEAFAHDHQRSVTRNSGLEQWDALTAKFAGAANLPFLLLQIPQIVLNARNLLAGNKTALLAVPWLGMFTGLLGNLSLLSYFAKKKEKEAVMVQTLGVISIYVVIAQLAMAEAMPLPHFIVTSIVVASGLVLNFLNYFDLLSAGIWRFWEDFITVAGLSVLPQVMWSTFVPYIPNSILPGMTAFFLAVAAVVMARMGKLPEKGIKFVGSISGWTATLLFMWMPVAQMWTNFLNPDNIKGLSAVSMLLAMIGNGLMIPRALFIRDFMCSSSATKRLPQNILPKQGLQEATKLANQSAQGSSAPELYPDLQIYTSRRPQKKASLPLQQQPHKLNHQGPTKDQRLIQQSSHQPLLHNYSHLLNASADVEL